MIEQINDDFSNLQKVLALLPLENTRFPSETLETLTIWSDQGNKVASYILGSLYIFGQIPRKYNFLRSYSLNEIATNARCNINEVQGLYHFAKLLELKTDNIFHVYLDGIYDFYRILAKKGNIFSNWDISIRELVVSDKNHELQSFFQNYHQLLNFLIALDYKDAYLDFAEHFFRKYKDGSVEDDLVKANQYLAYIISPDGIFSSDVKKHAQILTAEIILYTYRHQDYKKAIELIENADLDKGYCILLDWAKKQDGVYNDKIQKWIGLLLSQNLREKYENIFNLTAAPLSCSIPNFLDDLLDFLSQTELNNTSLEDSSSQQELINSQNKFEGQLDLGTKENLSTKNEEEVQIEYTSSEKVNLKKEEEFNSNKENKASSTELSNTSKTETLPHIEHTDIEHKQPSFNFDLSLKNTSLNIEFEELEKTTNDPGIEVPGEDLALPQDEQSSYDGLSENNFPDFQMVFEQSTVMPNEYLEDED